jgi:hypothetical protein
LTSLCCCRPAASRAFEVDKGTDTEPSGIASLPLLLQVFSAFYLLVQPILRKSRWGLPANTPEQRKGKGLSGPHGQPPVLSRADPTAS